MIYIEKDKVNLVALELSQTLPTCTSCSYVFEFVYEETTVDYTRYFTTADISPAPRRYNLFAVSESVAGSTGSAVSASTINLDPGQYQYNVYWSTGSIIWPAGIVGLVSSGSISTGRMVVAGTASAPYVTTTPMPLSQSVYD